VTADFGGFREIKHLLILGVVKRNPLFEIEWKNNGFLFTTPNNIQFISL